MKYKKYFYEFVGLLIIMTAALHFFNKQSIETSLLISSGASVLTVLNKFYLDRKKEKKQNQPKA